MKPIKTIKCKKLKKEFRIYKWEDKQFKDFKMPKGFDWAEHKDFIYLYDNDLIELEKYPVFYHTKNQSKKNIKNGWSLSRLCLYWDLDLGSGGGDLADSIASGRVVISRKIEGDKLK